jgi:hypothetical protein
MEKPEEMTGESLLIEGKAQPKTDHAVKESANKKSSPK